MTKKKEETAKTISKTIYYKECLSSPKITKMSVNKESKTHYWTEYEGVQSKLIPKTSVLNYEDAKIEYLEQEIERLGDALNMFRSGNKY